MRKHRSAIPTFSLGLAATYAEHARVASRLLMSAVAWVLVLLIVEAWVSFVLHQFAWTQRLRNFVIWLFALAMAYPYLPGANTEAFKALSVIASLMLSLGASSVVGQALSGLSLMYSRSLRVGE